MTIIGAMRPPNHAVGFFDQQFRQPATDAALKLNPFETLALPHLRGDTLDFGSGMGNLAFAAARQGCRVTALDASPAAIAHMQARAAAEALPLAATLADLRDYPIVDDYDCVVCIGLLMFFDRSTALKVLADLQAHVRPGGVVVVNVLIEGTTFLAMFDPAEHCLFTAPEIENRFAGWDSLHTGIDEFDAPGQTIKRFFTIIARRPPQLPTPPTHPVPPQEAAG